MSKQVVPAGDVSGLFERFEKLRAKARGRCGRRFGIIVIQEAGLDGFWIHRRLEAEGVESWVVDPASIATSRRRRRAKTDRLDGEALIRALLAYKRGEPRVCAMVRVPSVEEEDRRRVSRERGALLKERIRHANRIKGLLFSQGIGDYDPTRRDRRARLEELRTGDGRDLPACLKAQVLRELDRLELTMAQIKAVEKVRDAMTVRQTPAEPGAPEAPAPAADLVRLKGIGPELAVTLWTEGLYRAFANRRQVAAYCGLAPTPWQSGKVDREQGISKAGNPRLRHSMIELAWLWLQHQPQAELSLWYRRRIENATARQRKALLVGLARKLLIALWRYVNLGVVPSGAVLKGRA